MTTRTFLILLLLFFSSRLSIGQPLVLPLYPDGKIPLAKPCAFKETHDTTSEGRPSHYKKITTPLLYHWVTYKPNPNRRAVLVIPGGGYSFVSMEGEGRKVAERLASEGFEVFVLKYRLPSDSCMIQKQYAPLCDAMQALERVRKLGYLNVSVMGFSAGGHLAASLTLLCKKNPYMAPIEPPAFACLVYPAISVSTYPHLGSRQNLLGKTVADSLLQKFSLEKQVEPKTVPIFLIHSIDDETVSYQNSEMLFEALIKQKCHSEIHLFPLGGHGYGLGSVERKEAPNWMPLFLDFAERYGKK